MNIKPLIITLATLAIAHAEQPAPDADRAAILAMAGKFKVHFHFKETLPLQPGYELKSKELTEDAHELVVVAEDTPRRIALQHLLVVEGGHVIQHWRQIWTFEDARVCEFQGNNRWRVRVRPATEAAGTWTQLVTNVDNSPRYESAGRWQHEGGAARWVSGETWRPLPRREYKQREDYQVLGAINTHLITAAGWAHEQSNTKLALTATGTRALAREAGLNTYTRDTTADFATAERMWEKQRDIANAVSAEWDAVMARETAYEITDDIELTAMRGELKALAKDPLPTAGAQEKIRAILAKFIRPLPATARN